jgi:hypothetical protein
MSAAADDSLEIERRGIFGGPGSKDVEIAHPLLMEG